MPLPTARGDIGCPIDIFHVSVLGEFSCQICAYVFVDFLKTDAFCMNTRRPCAILVT
jgi:hypothetical protein